MVDLNISRKPSPTLWPWLIGLVVLALLIWGIAELVNTDRDNATMEEADSDDGSVAAAATPGAVPSAGPQPGTPGAAASGSLSGTEQAPAVTPAPLAALVPLGTQDIGQRVSVTGEVLTVPAEGGFWLRTDNRAVIWVKCPQRLKQGQQVQEVVGTIEPVRPGEPGATLDADVASARENQGVAFTPGLYLDASPAPQAAPAVAPASSGNGRGRSGTEARARPTKTKKPGRAG